MTTKTITGGRCACGSPVATNGSRRCENCRRFVAQIVCLRRATDLDRRSARSREWSLNNKERMRARQREHYARNTESRIASSRRYHEKRLREFDAMPKIPCACGCGTLIAPINTRGKPARYAQWHKKNGRIVSRGGYVSLRIGKDHPLADVRGYALEHRIVMSEAIGRPLRRDEDVHHINGIKDDNRLENLQIRKGKHGSGVAYRCCDCGSHNVEPTQLLDAESGQTHLVMRGV